MYEPDATTFVVARDGTHLATDIYLPRRPGRVPAVVARTPYGKASNVVWFPAIGRLFADNGMAFVAQDTRGRYASEGELAPFVEASDGWDTLEWITRQPWSDGSSAVFGESYVGFTAIAAAATAHPSLRAAALRNTGTDIEGDWLRHQGVLRLEFVIRWALAAWSGKDNLAPEFDWTQRPLAQIVQALSPIVGRERLPAVLDSWATGGRPVDMPQHEAQFPSLIDRVRVPTHLTTGWWDLFVRGATRDWARLSSRPDVDSRLVAEPTDHAGHDWGDGPTPDPLADFDALAARMPVVLASELTFLRKHLLGVDDGASAVSWMLTHAGVQQSPSWPPPGASPMTLHLVDGGRASHGPEGGGLSPRPDRVPVDARWRHDPADPVPSLEGEAVDGWFRQPDERLTHVRDDVLTYTSDPYRAPLDLAGPIAAELVVSAPSAGCHLMVKLSDVYPTGEARRIVDGAVLVPSGGGEARVVVDLGHTGYRVRGITGCASTSRQAPFPGTSFTRGTAEDAWSAARTRATRIGLRTGPQASMLRLTVR